jgi:hypothetical protein
VLQAITGWRRPVRGPDSVTERTPDAVWCLPLHRKLHPERPVELGIGGAHRSQQLLEPIGVQCSLHAHGIQEHLGQPLVLDFVIRLFVDLVFHLGIQFVAIVLVAVV